ncbi:MAG TPA: TonB family protein [Vicinamibacterales bacterium]|jgi:protein TonB
MPTRRIITLASVVIHAIAICAVVVAQLLAVGPYPTPHRPLAFDDPMYVKVMDIDLPAPQRMSAAPASRATVSPNAAPVVAPQGIIDETGIENVSLPVGRIEEPNAVVGTGNGVGSLPVGTGVEPPTPPPPVAPVRLSTGMQAPRKIVDVTPTYPAMARTARVEGVVILEAVIDAEGRVESVRVLRSIPLLDQAAMDAVRQWKFTPTRLNGTPVPIVMTVTVNFKLQ